MIRKPFEYSSTLKEQVCQCGKNYPAKWILIVDQWRDTTSGMCKGCFDKWKEETKAAETRELYVKQEAAMKTITDERRARFRENISGIPLYYQTKTFERIKSNVKGNMQKVCPECMRYANNYPLNYSEYIKMQSKSYPSLFITSPGNWGVGKTHLVCAILHRVLDRWQGKPNYCPVLFITEPDIYMKIQNTYSFSNNERTVRQSETDIIQELINVPLLAIDDIGKQKRSDMKFVQRTLFAIFNGRYDNMNPTIMTANMNLEQLENYVGAKDNGEFDKASFDRILELCKGNFWLLEGESQRGK